MQSSEPASAAPGALVAVLAGGEGRRLGGAKAQALLAGRRPGPLPRQGRASGTERHELEIRGRVERLAVRTLKSARELPVMTRVPSPA